MTARRALLVLALSVALTVLLAAEAGARPPVVTSVGAIDRQVTARWTLPEGVDAQFVQIATDPAVTQFGYYTEPHLVSFSVLGRSDRTFKDSLRLQPGTYYVHISGADSGCYPDCPRIEFSNSFRIRIDASGNGQGTNLAQEGEPPSQLVSCRRRQSLRKVRVKARMDINGSLSAAGKLTAGSPVGRSRIFPVGPVTKPAAANTTVNIPLKLSKAAVRAARRSLAAGRKPLVSITVTARDGAGRTTARSIIVRLTR